MIRRINQGGSTKSFVVVGIILSIGFIAAIYTLNQHGQQVRKDLVATEYQKEQATKKSSDKPVSPTDNKSKTTEPVSVKAPTVSSGGSSELPVTGINFSFINFFSLYLLVFFATSYIISRQSLSRPL